MFFCFCFYLQFGMAEVIYLPVLEFLGLSIVPVLDRTVVAGNTAVDLCLLPADWTGKMLANQVPWLLQME